MAYLSRARAATIPSLLVAVLIPLHSLSKTNSTRTVIMNSFGKDTCWATAVRWLAGGSTLIYVFSRFIPCTPPNDRELFHVSWVQALHVAFDQHLQFGRDIVFTYGPWGFLNNGYYPPTHLVSVIAWIMLSLVFWRAGWRLARHLSDNLLFSWLWLIGFTGMACMPVEDNIDARLTAWMVLLLFLHFFVEEGSFSPTQALLVVSLGLLSLVKFTGLMESVMVVAVIAADNICRHRRFPWIVPLLAASFLCFWIVAGQHLSSLGLFFLNSWRITSGYTEAMMRTVKNEIQNAGCFLMMATLLCTLIGYVAWLRHRFFGMLPLLGLVAIVFISFKSGYVRNDEHETFAVMGLSVASLAGLAIAWPVAKQSVRLASLLLLVVILFFASSTLSRCFSREQLPEQLARTLDIHRVLAPIKLLSEPGYLREAYEKSLADVRAKYPIPPMGGEGDIYSMNQAILFAYGLRYHARPVVQSYSAYTPELAELNAAWLRTGRAASNLLFIIEPIDHRFPALEDGRSWPELLTRYHLTRYHIKNTNDALGTCLLLSRSAVPREYHLTPLQRTSIHFGEPVNPPSATNGLIWAEIEMEKSLIGTMVSTLYKPPILVLTVSLRDGRQFDFRLIPAMARSGFLLSPVIGDTMSFALLASTDGQAQLAGREVMSMTISARTQSGSTICYRLPIQLRFYRLDINPVMKFHDRITMEWTAEPADK
ncbi:MAG: hypothetical protein ABSH11_09920 [Verrucomicrobiota bacterium]